MESPPGRAQQWDDCDPDIRTFVERVVAALRAQLGGARAGVFRERHARAFTHPLPFELHFNEDWKDRIRRGDVGDVAERRDRDLAAHCTVARGGGALLGPLPAELFAPVPWADFVDAVLDDFAWIVEGDHIPESPYYAVLDACRVLQLLTAGEGTIANKEEGALWARDLTSPRRAVHRCMS